MLENYDPRAKWYDKSWQMNSDDLFEKWGFLDGNLFDDLCLDNEINGRMPDPKALLKMVVETFLLPEIPCQVDIYEANTTHNRVRAEDGFKELFEAVEVTITGKQIFQMLDKKV